MPDIARGIIDFFTSPPIENLDPALDENGPFTAGSHTFELWRHDGVNRSVLDTYGVYISFSGIIPQQLGMVLGYDDGFNLIQHRYWLRLAQVVQQSRLASGAWIPTDVIDIYRLPYVLRWTQSQPTRIGLHVLPSVQVDMYYLVVG